MEPALRPAAMEDAKLLFDWANEPEVRRASFVSEPIAWDGHLKWLEGRLKNPACRILIGSDEKGEPFGVIRFEPRPQGGATVSVSVDKRARGAGRGERLIAAGTAAYLKAAPDAEVHAYVRPDNAASLKAFAKAGYVETARELVRGQAAVHLVRSGR